MFVLFGLMGFVWCGAWILSFKEIRITTPDDDYIIVPTKVIVHIVIYICL